VLQTKRIKYYRNETDPTCLLCGAAEENVLHFILQCEKLQSERVALLSLLDRPSRLATLAEFFLVGFTLIVLSIN
jgi:hypothetical protein